MPFSGRSAVVAMGRQTAYGTALTSPKLETPMGAGFVGPQRETDILPYTTGTQGITGSFLRQNSAVVSGITIPALPISSGVILQGILGTLATTGASAPYTHTVTPNDTMPYMTWFFQQPGTNYHTVSDVKLSQAVLNFTAGGPVEWSIDGLGKAATRTQPATKWTAATVVDAIDPFFSYIGAVVKLDGGTTPATTVVRDVQNGNISINRNVTGLQTDDVVLYSQVEQTREIMVSLGDCVVEDNNFINTVFYGTPTGTAQATQTVKGSFEIQFKGSDGVAAATRGLKITIPQILWTVEAIPGADPSGAPVVITKSGTAEVPAAGGAEITAVLNNGNAGTTIY